MRGAADADGDGRVSYGEMQSFIAQAKLQLDESFRPLTLSDPPADDDTLLYLTGSQRVLVVDRHFGDHLYVADLAGNRYVDMRAGEQVFSLVLPSGRNGLFLVDVAQAVSYPIPDTGRIALSELSPSPYDTARARGPSEQFARLFGTAFDRDAHLRHRRKVMEHAHLSPLVHSYERGRNQGTVWTLAASAVGLGVAAGALAWWGHARYAAMDDAWTDPGRQRDDQLAGSRLYGAARGMGVAALLTGAVAVVLHGLDRWGDDDDVVPAL
jgi:hypothetical protein